MSHLEVDHLEVYFKTPGGSKELRAVDGVSLNIGNGESLGLVGESGCGKTTLGNAIMGLIPITGGSIHFNGKEISGLQGRNMKPFRKQVQMIFQDPFGSLNPRMSVGACILEVLQVHGLDENGGKKKCHDRMLELLKMVGLDQEYASHYPHEFSGGQRQRIGIARALAVNPSLIIADEPVSALDVSVQIQILNLMKDIQKQMNLSYLFIAHDLAVVRYICDRILVMYMGKIVESALADELFAHPAHPYTKALLSAVPDVEKGLRARKQGSSRIVLKGDVPSAFEIISGCPFHPRCPYAEDICKEQAPVKKSIGKDHFSVCHY